jgi:hypothetical protein
LPFLQQVFETDVAFVLPLQCAHFMLEVIQSTIFEHGIRMWQSSRGATKGAGGGTVVGAGGGTAVGAIAVTKAAGKATKVAG